MVTDTTTPLPRPFKVVALFVGLTIALFVTTPASDFVADHGWALALFVVWAIMLVAAAHFTSPKDF